MHLLKLFTDCLRPRVSISTIYFVLTRPTIIERKNTPVSTLALSPKEIIPSLFLYYPLTPTISTKSVSGYICILPIAEVAKGYSESEKWSLLYNTVQSILYI